MENLALTLKQTKRDSMFTRAALAIAMESYNDLQNGFGFLMRKNNLIDNEEVTKLISRFQHTAVSELITINADDAVLLYTSCGITMKVMLSEEADRFIMLDDRTKHDRFKKDIIEFCKDMAADFLDQAIYRYELNERKTLLENIIEESF